MTVEVKMPQMGESIAEGTLVKWHKRPGEKVQRDEPLFEISTDKVDTEVPSPVEGYLARVLVKEGETVPVHTVVCVLSDSAQEEKEAQAEQDAGPSDRLREHAPREAPATPPTSIGRQREAVEHRETGQRGNIGRPAQRGSEPLSSEERLREKSSPLVRRLAAEHGIDLSRIEGSGTAGRVTKEDFLRYLNEQGGGTTASPASLPALADHIEPLSVMRKRIAEHMTLSRRTSAHVSTVFEVDMTAVRALRDTLAQQFERQHGVKLTYLPFIIEAVCANLRRFPLLNASIEGENVHYHGQVAMGIAVALDDGLIVPVIRDAEKKDLVALARAVNDIAARARSKKLSPEEVHGGTFTITNPGVFGSLIGTPIINQPQAAILCVGAIQKRPIVLPDADAIAIRTMVYLSLTFDHRLIDGAVADRFMAGVKAALEDPRAAAQHENPAAAPRDSSRSTTLETAS